MHGRCGLPRASALALAIALAGTASAELKAPGPKVPPPPRLDAPPPMPVMPPARRAAERAQVDLLADDFEAAFPGDHWVRFVTGGAADANWALASVTASSGTTSVFCAGAGAASVRPGLDLYPENMGAWMFTGPFDLSDASSAVASLSYSLQSEAGFDFFYVVVSTDPTFATSAYMTDSGNSGGWISEAVDLGDVNGTSFLGQPAVYVAFLFTSDEAVGEIGAFVDDVFIAKNTSGTTPSATPTPTATATPSPTPVKSPTPTPTVTPAATATASASATPTPSSTAATPTPSATPSFSPTPAPTATPGGTATPSPTPSPTPTEVATSTPAPTPSPSPTPSASASASPTAAPTPAPEAVAAVLLALADSTGDGPNADGVEDAADLLAAVGAPGR